MFFGLQNESPYGGIYRLIYTLLILCAVIERSTATRYAIVVDAGSTGTRAFVFQEVFYEEERIIHTFPCGKERMGLSSYAANLTSVADLFIPLLRTAAKTIPVNYHRITSLFVRGTAGMRLLSDSEQNALWDSLVHQLKSRRDIPFHIDKKNFGTISGYQEAFYAVLASNYIVGSIDGNRKLIEGASLIGALDMGGSSNQLVIYNGSNPKAKIETNHFWSYSWLRYGAEMMRERLLRHIYEAHFNTDMLLQSHQTHDMGNNTNSSSSEDGIIRLQNPCAFEDYMDSYIDNILFIGTGDSKECIQLIERVVWAAPATSDSSSSSSSDSNADGELITDEITGDGRIQNLDTTTDTTATASSTLTVENDNMEVNMATIIDDNDGLIQIIEEQEENMNDNESTDSTTMPSSVWGCSHGPCAIDDIYHPSVQGHKFYAMSVYYYALDCVRQLGPEPLPHWPTPSIAELRAAADRFCALPWDHVQNRYDSATGPQYTYPSQLPYRCLEALYIVTLLEKGFGFDPHGRSITLALEVGGKEVEWTLGYALAEVDFTPAPKVAHLEVLAKLTTPMIEELNEAREESHNALQSYITLLGNAMKMLGSVTKETLRNGKILQEQYDTIIGRFLDAWTWK